MSEKDVSIEELVGATLIGIVGEVGDEVITFQADDGRQWQMYHEHQCCEDVRVEDIAGDLADLLGEPILLAEEVVSDENPPGVDIEWQDSFTWTFYKLATNKGRVTIRWYGSSNGYYSESVTFTRTRKQK